MLVNAIIDRFPIRNGVDYTSSLAGATRDDFRAVARRYLDGLPDACDLHWDPACLEFHKLERLVATISAAQVRQPVYGSSVGAWKPFEKMIEPLLNILS